MFSTKWSDYTFDICPYCGGHMGMFASMYAFQFCFICCPHCGGPSQSSCVFDKGTTFQWVLIDDHANQICVEAHKMVSEALYGDEEWEGDDLL